MAPCCYPYHLLVSDLRSWIGKLLQNVPSFCNCYIEFSVPGSYGLVSSMAFGKSDNIGPRLSFYVWLQLSSSVLVWCIRFVRLQMSCLTRFFVVSWILIVCLCICGYSYSVLWSRLLTLISMDPL